MNRLFLFLLIISNSIFAQQKERDTYTVYINYPNYTVKANIYSELKKMSVKDTLVYYWYSSNKIMQTQGGFDGKLFHGTYTSFYLSNNLMEKGGFRNGLKTGLWNNWFENGKIKESMEWKNGLRNGGFKQFDENGNLLISTNYKKGKLNGEYIQYSGNKSISDRKYKNGKEVIVVVKDKKTALIKEDPKEKKTFKNKIRSVFRKKEKEESVAKTAEPAEVKPEKKKKKEHKAPADKNAAK